MSPLNSEQTRELFRAILKLENEEECRAFFEDVCTFGELIEMSRRLDVAKKLIEGKTFAQVSEETGASTATISRVNRCVLYGGGGYRSILSRLTEEKEK